MWFKKKKDPNTKKALIVDDEEDILQILAAILEFNDYEVIRAQTTASALDRLKENAFQIMVVDIMLDEENGLELCRQIREEDQWKPLPILVYSAKQLNSEERIRLRDMNCQYLRKPSSQQNIMDKILGMNS